MLFKLNLTTSPTSNNTTNIYQHMLGKTTSVGSICLLSTTHVGFANIPNTCQHHQHLPTRVVRCWITNTCQHHQRAKLLSSPAHYLGLLWLLQHLEPSRELRASTRSRQISMLMRIFSLFLWGAALSRWRTSCLRRNSRISWSFPSLDWMKKRFAVLDLYFYLFYYNLNLFLL